MARSVSFTIDGDVDTLVTITELGDGTLQFDLEILGSGAAGSLRALYFDLEGVDADTLEVTAAGEDVSGYDAAEGAISGLGGSTNINGEVVEDYDKFDVGVSFGESSSSILETTFILSADTDLSLDMLDLADFGIRYLSTDSGVVSKVGSTGGDVAADDSVTVEENGTASFDVLANDTGDPGRVVTALGGNGTAGSSGEFEVAMIVGGLDYGTLRVAADGTATLVADGPDAAALMSGDTVVFETSYRSEGADGSTATAGITVTIDGTSAGVIDFEDVTTEDFAPVPAGYRGFVWDGSSILAVDTDAALYVAPFSEPGGSYIASAGSAFAGGSDNDLTVTRADGGVFDFAGGSFGAFGPVLPSQEPTNLTVYGYRDGSLVGSASMSMSLIDVLPLPGSIYDYARETISVSLDLQDVDTIVFERDGIGALLMDDLIMG